MTDPGIRRNDLCNDDIGPAPTQGNTQVIDDVGQHGPEHDMPGDLPGSGADRKAGFDELFGHPLGVVPDQQDQLEKRPHPEYR